MPTPPKPRKRSRRSNDSFKPRKFRKIRPTCTSFPRFPSLPAELRVLIWKFAASHLTSNLRPWSHDEKQGLSMPWYRTTLPGLLGACYLSRCITLGMVEKEFEDIWPLGRDDDEREIFPFKPWICGSCQNRWMCRPPKPQDSCGRKAPVRRLIFVPRRTVVVDGVLQPEEKGSCDAYCKEGKKWRKREAVRLELAGVGRRERMGIFI